MSCVLMPGTLCHVSDWILETLFWFSKLDRNAQVGGKPCRRCARGELFSSVYDVYDLKEKGVPVNFVFVNCVFARNGFLSWE